MDCHPLNRVCKLLENKKMLVTPTAIIACPDFVCNLLILKNREGEGMLVIGHRILPKWSRSCRTRSAKDMSPRELNQFQGGCIRVERTFRFASRLCAPSSGFQPTASQWAESLTREGGVDAALKRRSTKPRKQQFGDRSNKAKCVYS